jgi:uncharacterized cupredoxin-like copper-binding protein
MNRVHIARGALVMIIGIAGVTACSSDSDKGSATTTTGGGVTVPTGEGTPVAVTTADEKGLDGPMTMTAVPDSVAAGSVTFNGDNTGTIEHEVVVLKTDTPGADLVVTDGKVSEDESVGEIAEFAAGATSSVTLDLDAGSYVLVCNVKDHYELGMWTAFTVTE